MVPPSLRPAFEAFGIVSKKPERWVRIKRDPSSDTGTPGVLTTDSGLRLYSLELPDKANKPGLSRIPEGEYLCELGDFPKHGKCYEVKAVPGRTAVLFHVGNFGGDIEKGKRSDTEGCILVGNCLGEAYDSKGGKRQDGLLGSRDAFARFMDDRDGEPFQLIIS